MTLCAHLDQSDTFHSFYKQYIIVVNLSYNVLTAIYICAAYAIISYCNKEINTLCVRWLLKFNDLAFSNKYYNNKLSDDGVHIEVSINFTASCCVGEYSVTMHAASVHNILIY